MFFWREASLRAFYLFFWFASLRFGSLFPYRTEAKSVSSKSLKRRSKRTIFIVFRSCKFSRTSPPMALYPDARCRRWVRARSWTTPTTEHSRRFRRTRLPRSTSTRWSKFGTTIKRPFSKTQISFLPSEQFNVHLDEQTHFKPFSRFWRARPCGHFRTCPRQEQDGGLGASAVISLEMTTQNPVDSLYNSSTVHSEYLYIVWITTKHRPWLKCKTYRRPVSTQSGDAEQSSKIEKIQEF